MGKRKTKRTQTELFSQDPNSMQWEKLPETSRRNTQWLFAQLFISVLSHNQRTQTEERHHAIEDYK